MLQLKSWIKICHFLSIISNLSKYLIMPLCYSWFLSTLWCSIHWSHYASITILTYFPFARVRLHGLSLKPVSWKWLSLPCISLPSPQISDHSLILKEPNHLPSLVYIWMVKLCWGEKIIIPSKQNGFTINSLSPFVNAYHIAEIGLTFQKPGQVFPVCSFLLKPSVLSVFLSADFASHFNRFYFQKGKLNAFIYIFLLSKPLKGNYK